jgi:hypothetical protein
VQLWELATEWAMSSQAGLVKHPRQPPENIDDNLLSGNSRRSPYSSRGVVILDTL